MITSFESSGKLKGRIAPTPSGYLHIGNAYNFLFSWLVCKKLGASLLLRIDDLDQERVRSTYLDDIFRTLDWLGISPDEGPSSTEEHINSYSQMLRVERYESLIDRLKEKLFACAYSRKQILANSSDGQYPLTFREQAHSLTEPGVAWRILTPENSFISWQDKLMGQVEVNLFSTMRDFVIRKKDGQAAYQLASLADDLFFGVNCICRGRDLLHSTAAQLFLAELLGEGQFQRSSFYHHCLLTNEEGNKLSKSHASLSMHETDYSPLLKQGLFDGILLQLGKERKSISTAEALVNSLSLAEILQIGGSLRI